MIKFDRQKHSRLFVSNPGSPLHKVMHGEVQDDGSIKLVVDRIEDTDELINAQAPATRIENIMARIQAGEIQLLNQKHGFYLDTENMPKTYAEFLDLMHRGEEYFNRLPVEVKEKYNNDFSQFFAVFDKAIAELNPKQQKEAEQIIEKENSEE